MIKNQSRVVILIYMIGFLLGIVYMNMSAGEYISSMGIFNRNFAEQFRKADIAGVQYLGYLVRLRVLPAIILALIGTTRFRKIGSTAFLVWTGILCGVYFTCAVMNHGVSGVLFCVAGLLPHMVCYLFAYGILLMTIFFYPKKQWNYEKTIAFCLAICMGIALEYKANPVLVKLILKRV